MPNSVTAKDVAREAGVSIVTVSRVFNNHKNVTEEVRQRVLQTATQLGYFKSRNARGHQDALLYEGKGSTLKEIGFLYYSPVDKSAVTVNPFWSHILHGVEMEARKTNTKVTYYAIGELCYTPELLLKTVKEMKLEGILLVGAANRETIQSLQTLSLPLVLVDNAQTGVAVDAVLSDNFEGACIAVNYLISEGHQKIAFIDGSIPDGAPSESKIYTIERRAAGYRFALREAGLPFDSALYQSATLGTDGGYAACQRLLALNTPFSAIFCANDETAIGAIKALREAGKRVPEDVSVIGFDDIDMAEHLTPSLTTIRVNKEALGSVAVKSLVMRSHDMDAVNVTYLLDVELIKRGSVASYSS